MKREEIERYIYELYDISSYENKRAILKGLLELIPFELLQTINKVDQIFENARKTHAH
jgi:hypothetical protein